MKNYSITVNGNLYEVSVEENVGGFQTAAPVVQAKVPVAPAAPVAAANPVVAKPVVAKPAAPASAGSVKVNSPMPGKILALKATVGQALKRGDVVIILEAMKMENEIVAPQDGTLASINVTIGQNAEAGEILFTLN